MHKIKCPAGLNRAETKLFRSLFTQLIDRGIDPIQREALLTDYVFLETRIAKLRLEETDGKGLAISRALNVATAERRRLHAAVFAGARAVVPLPTPAEQAAATAQSEADDAWRAHFVSLKSLQGHHPDKDAEGAALEKRFGQPSWTVLLEP